MFLTIQSNQKLHLAPCWSGGHVSLHKRSEKTNVALCFPHENGANTVVDKGYSCLIEDWGRLKK